MILEVRFGPGELPPEAAPRTTVRLEKGMPCHAEAHQERLHAGLRAMGEKAEWLDARLEQTWEWARAQAGATPFLALRILADPTSLTLHVRLESVPETPTPYTLVPKLHPLAEDWANPLTPHKGCLGAWNRDVLAAAQAQGAQDALLHWGDATLAETAIAAVGCLEGRRFVLPLRQGRVRSIAELRDLPRWADEQGWEVTTESLPLQRAVQGQLWCFNALRGLWPAQALRTPR